MSNQHEHLWDGDGEDAGDAFDRKLDEWEQRDWMTWLKENLVFPFKATREEDFEHSFFDEAAAKAPFGVGHTMEVLGLEEEEDEYGIRVKAKEKGRVGEVPLCDLEVKPKTDKNYWPVREYVVWFANR